MPMLVRTPEDIFRAEKKDLYVIHSKEEVERDAPGLLMIKEWVKANLPGTKMELLAPSEHSGMICGGIGKMIRIDFSPEGLQAFCDRWEQNDASVDPRFQCFIYPYERWWNKHGRYVPTNVAPQKPGVASWWYTPIGFIHHTLDPSGSDVAGMPSHPATPSDIWAHAVEIWPDLKSVDPDQLTYGRVHWSKSSQKYSVTRFEPLWGADDAKWVPTASQVMAWFGLPESTEYTTDI